MKVIVIDYHADAAVPIVLPLYHGADALMRMLMPVFCSAVTFYSGF